DCRRRTAGAPDNEMHADQWSFIRKERIECRDTSDECVREIRADLGADAAVVSFTRHEHEHRHKTVEAVVPGEDAHAWPFIKLQDRERKAIERLFVDLEQLVTWIVLQHIRQRFAGVAAGIEAGTKFNRRDLAAKIRNAVRRAR